MVQDIKFWIVFFFLIRLIGITNAPLEVAHNWRQTSVNMVARNFQEIDNNILFPRFDLAGKESGISGTEFPLFNYLIYLLNLLLGYSHWYGRLINLIVSTIGTWFFYRLVKTWISPRVALYATIIFLSSLWFTYSRKIMPDTFSISLCLVGLWYGLEFMRENKTQHLFLYIIFATLGILSKIPAAVTLSVLFIPLINQNFGTTAKIKIIAVSVIPLGFAAFWYFYWFEHISSTYKIYSMGPGVVKGFFQLFNDLDELLDNFYFDALKYSGAALFLYGIFWAFTKKDRLPILIISIGSLTFFVFMMQAGWGFAYHEYYTLPFVPFMALIVGYAVSQIKHHAFRLIVIGVILMEGILNQQHDFFIKPRNLYKLKLESILDPIVPQNELVIINGGPNPQLMYFAHRRGWSIKQLSEKKLSEMMDNGARYMILDKHESMPELTNGQIQYEDDDFLITKL